jgi:cell division protein FtsZ
MFHRIQNRNSGYSDSSKTSSAQTFNFSPTMSSPVTHGANALKLENEVINEVTKNISSTEIPNEQVESTQGIETESIVENNEVNDIDQSFSEEAFNVLNETEETNLNEEGNTSNGLENFGAVDEDAPDLFNSDNKSSESQDLLSRENTEDSSEDDDLEIPAFLRRQKN